MPEERPQIPPPRFAVREFHSPNFADGFYTEVIKRTDPGYLAIGAPRRGALYSTIMGANPQVIAQFPNLYFLDEQRLGTDHESVVWIWATDPAAQDSYNAEVVYAEDQLAYPTYKRVYTVRRDVRDAGGFGGAIFDTLTSLIAIRVDAVGAGYSKQTAITFSSGSAKAVPVIAAGAIIAIIVTKGGGTYTVPPTVIITDVGGGQSASATAMIQPQSALFVRQIEQEFPDESPWRWEFVRISNEYRTLPGPVVTEFIEHPQTSIPLVVSNQEIAANTVTQYRLGTFQPPPISVSSITNGTTPIVGLAGDHGLPIGAWVTFAGTNSTPPLDGTWQIVGVPGPRQVQVTPTNPITVAGTFAGTMVSTNQVQREIKRTENGNVKMKVETIVAVPDVSVFDEDVETQEDYPYPDFLEAINLYRDSARGGTINTGDPLNYSTSLSSGAAVGLPAQAGYRGPNPGSHRKRFFFVGNPPASFEQSWTPTIIIPSQGTFEIENFTNSYSQSVNASDPTNTSKSYSLSNNWRTGTISPVITGPSPTITDVNGIVSLTVTNITTGAAPVVTVGSTSVLANGMWVTISGTNSVPTIDGIWKVLTVLSGTTFDLDTPFLDVASAGTVGTVTVGAVAKGTLDLPQSVPPLIVASLTVNGITTGAAPVITLNGTHYWQPGQYVQLAGTTSTPSLDGLWQIATVPLGTKITLVSPPTVTGAQSSPAGTANGFITIMEQPQKLEVAGLWQCYVRLIKIRYTSGQVP